jgi:predicted Zn-dependent protease
MKRMLLFGLLLTSLGAQAQEDVVFRALRDEMRRSMSKLQLDELDKPYFVSYRIVDDESKEVSATLGSVLASSENRTRFLTVNVRVGDYSLDNSNFLSSPVGGTGVAVQMFAGTVQLPLDDDYRELRRQIWLATDGAYKKALEDLSGKRAALQNKNRTEPVPDFSRATPVSIEDLAPRIDVDLQDATRLVRAASAVFRKVPSIQASLVQFSADNRLERFLNSEGSAFTRMAPRVSLRITASTQASDGMPLGDFVTAYGYSMKDLPSESVLLPQIRQMVEGLSKLQTAAVEDDYNGPVLFEGQAAAAVFASRFAEQLPVQPHLVSNNEQFLEALRSQQSSGLLNKMGARVFPGFLDVVDDPTATREKESLLFGGYKVDEEGVPSKQTLVIHHGMLKTVLTSRAPVRGVLESTGNLREHGVAPSNLFVIADKTSTAEGLMKQLLDTAKSRGNHYGIVVRRLSGKSAILAYRAYEDGREELIRNADIAGLNAASFKDILAVSDQRVVYTEATPPRNSSPFGANPLSGGQPLQSYVVPSLLFDDVTIERPSAEIPKPPVTSSPLLEKQ